MSFLQMFNWKKEPKNVLYIALSLAGLGVGLHILSAILRLKVGDPWYLVITVVILTLGGFALYPLYKSLKALGAL